MIPSYSRVHFVSCNTSGLIQKEELNLIQVAYDNKGVNEFETLRHLCFYLGFVIIPTPHPQCMVENAFFTTEIGIVSFDLSEVSASISEIASQAI